MVKAVNKVLILGAAIAAGHYTLASPSAVAEENVASSTVVILVDGKVTELITTTVTGETSSGAAAFSGSTSNSATAITSGSSSLNVMDMTKNNNVTITVGDSLTPPDGGTLPEGTGNR